MADLIAAPAADPPAAPRPARPQPDDSGRDRIRIGIELLYFAYSRLYLGIDAGLARQGLGRAHHRALYFIGRQDGVTIGDLLRILGITKQSLHRVIGDLERRGLIAIRQGDIDRRQRLLHLTPDGSVFEAELFAPLQDSMARAYRDVPPAAIDDFLAILWQLIPADERALAPVPPPRAATAGDVPPI